MEKDGVRLVLRGRGGGVGDNGDDVIEDDNDGGDCTNFDKVCDNVADMLNDILGRCCGERLK